MDPDQPADQDLQFSKQDKSWLRGTMVNIFYTFLIYLLKKEGSTYRLFYKYVFAN